MARRGATALINQLGLLMGTSPTTGTTDINVRNGLSSYLNSFYENRFSVGLVYASKIGGGLSLWNFMTSELFRGEDVIPLITWNSGGGHAVDMTSFHDDPAIVGDERIDINDPATNGTTHNWNGEYLSINITGFGANGISLAPWASGTGFIDAVVVASPVTAPPALALVGSGLIFITAFHLRRGKARAKSTTVFR